MKAITKQRNRARARKPKASHPWRKSRFGKGGPPLDDLEAGLCTDTELLPTHQELEVLPLSSDEDIVNEYSTDNHAPGQEDWRDFSELED